MTDEIKKAVIRTLEVRADHENYGCLSTKLHNAGDFRLLCDNHIRIEDDVVLENNFPVFEIRKQFSNRKHNGMYRTLTPKLISILPK